LTALLYRFQWIHKSDHFLNAYQVGTKADVQKMESQAKAEAQRLWTEAEMKRTRSA